MEVLNLPSETTTATNEGANDSTSNISALQDICYNFDRAGYSVAIQFILAVIIFTLNAVVIIAMLTGPKKTYHKPAFVFIASLSITDILLSVILVMFCVISIGGFQLSAKAWVLITASTSVCYNASVNFLLLIALDRLLFIAYNQRYKKLMKKRNIKMLIGLAWFIGAIPVLPMYFSGVGSCAELCDCIEDEFLSCAHQECSVILLGFTRGFLFGLVFYFIIMLISICAVYFCLFWKVHSQSKRVGELTGRTNSGRTRRMEREFKLARTLGIVVAVFFVCWAPLMILYVVEYAMGNKFNLDRNLILGIMFPTIVNSMLNPIIYAARIPRMRLYLCPCLKTEESSVSNEANRNSWPQKIKRNIASYGSSKGGRSKISVTPFPSEDTGTNITELRNLAAPSADQNITLIPTSQVTENAAMNIVSWKYESSNSHK